MRSPRWKGCRCAHPCRPSGTTARSYGSYGSYGSYAAEVPAATWVAAARLPAAAAARGHVGCGGTTARSGGNYGGGGARGCGAQQPGGWAGMSGLCGCVGVGVDVTGPLQGVGRGWGVRGG
ncbi:hypothetical protein SHKM778_71670 [Streptomyces sp. KM77-8]|uniref:Uncharacterized protein n=1 Tax=Streptomyces haneummycinicus TaxID=3074435 RepID=A0AAT9HTS3_9ACTN